MIYNTRNHWISGLSPSSGIVNTRKQRLETECEGRKTPNLFGYPVIRVLSKVPNRVGVSLLSPEDGNRSSF
jgi:hypothetical protein